MKTVALITTIIALFAFTATANASSGHRQGLRGAHIIGHAVGHAIRRGHVRHHRRHARRHCWRHRHWAGGRLHRHCKRNHHRHHRHHNR